MKRTWIAIAALAGVSLVGDFICRSQANSSGRDKLLDVAGERVHLLPARIGNWRVSESKPLDDEVLRMLRCRAHESRTYVDDQTGESVSLVLLTGTAGPLLAHTPEVCYSSVDFDTEEPAHPEIIRGAGDSADQFYQVMFRTRKKIAGDRQRVYYGWRKPQGTWQAPRNPRLTLGGQPMLYKLQLAVEVAAGLPKDQSAADPARRFLDDLLPVLDKTLSAKP